VYNDWKKAARRDSLCVLPVLNLNPDPPSSSTESPIPKARRRKTLVDIPLALPRTSSTRSLGILNRGAGKDKKIKDKEEKKDDKKDKKGNK
jgi:hypothetical protein